MIILVLQYQNEILSMFFKLYHGTFNISFSNISFSGHVKNLILSYHVGILQEQFYPS